MTVLIITFSEDNESIPLVMDAIEAKGEKAFRFDTDRFPTDVQLDIYHNTSHNRSHDKINHPDTEKIIITDGDKRLDLSDVSSIWYRRMRYGGKLPETLDKQHRNAAIQECRTSVRGMIASLKGFHFDRMSDVDLANNKQLQLQVAKQVGLETPRTLTTNNPDAVKQFALECKTQGIITKMLSSFAIYDEKGAEFVVFTNPVSDEDLQQLEGLQFCPMTFQEKVPKMLELRTIIVGHQVFTAAIDSQGLEGSIHDWRKEGQALINAWQLYHLPTEIEQKLLKLLTYFGLNYGAIDIILTPDSRYIFLEVNPVGEFFWLETCAPHFPISQAIAEILLTHKP